MGSRLKWKLAQRYEKAWWKRYLKRNEQEYTEYKKDYWSNILKIISEKSAENKTVLDVGCGPSGIYMLLDKSLVTAVDPLIEDYEKELSVFSKEKYPWVKFISDKIETFESEQTYDYIFCMNSLNHVDAILLTIQKLSKMLKEDGNLILSIDVHNYKIFKYFLRYTGLDVLHPHQLSLTDYSMLLAKEGIIISKKVLLKKRFVFNHLLLIAKKAS